MKPHEKAALHAFMIAIYEKFHPNRDDYPWEAMDAASKGTGSLYGTFYEGTYMAEAWYLLRALTDFEK